MLRLTANSLKALTIEAFNPSEAYPALQIIRWKRKPIGSPPAKSKLFRIPPRIQEDPDEHLELQRLFNNYRTQIKSIRRYLTYKYCTRLQASADPETQMQIFLDDLERCNEINNEWNAEVARSREERVASTLQQDLAFAKQRIEYEDKKSLKKMGKAEKLVQKEKEVAKDFITADNIDAAIEHSLANPVDYNFAIDLKGQRILGRDTRVEEQASVKQ